MTHIPFFITQLTWKTLHNYVTQNENTTFKRQPNHRVTVHSCSSFLIHEDFMHFVWFWTGFKHSYKYSTWRHLKRIWTYGQPFACKTMLVLFITFEHLNFPTLVIIVLYSFELYYIVTFHFSFGLVSVSFQTGLTYCSLLYIVWKGFSLIFINFSASFSLCFDYYCMEGVCQKRDLGKSVQ